MLKPLYHPIRNVQIENHDVFIFKIILDRVTSIPIRITQSEREEFLFWQNLQHKSGIIIIRETEALADILISFYQ